jgi:hypothetical protein
MEAKGAFKIVSQLYNSPAGVFVRTYVMDDDSSTKSIILVKHLLQARIDNDDMFDADWPLTEAGVRVRDTGMLPINHPETFLVTRTIKYAMLDTLSSWRRWQPNKTSVILVTPRG